jgi:hypothetical protein
MRTLGQIGWARWRWSLALAAGAFVLGLAPLADGDLWWHLAAGREMVRTHAFISTDPFSAGAAGRPWVDVHWLFQLGAYGLFALAGLRGLVIAKCALVAAGALVLADAVARAAGPRARAVVVPVFVSTFLAALFAARGLLLLRPVIPTLVFLAIFFAALEGFTRRGRLALLAPLPFVQVAWANTQALAMLGPALVGAYALASLASGVGAGRRWFPFAPEHDAAEPEHHGHRASRALLATLALCLAACFATPYGARAAALPFALLGRLWPGASNVYSANVAENVPPWIVEQGAPGQFGHLGLGIALLALALAAARAPRLSHVLVAIGLVALALSSNRNVLLLYWLATPIAVVSAAPALRRARIAWARSRLGHGRPLLRAVPAGATVAAALVVLGLGGVAAARETSLGEPAPWRAPVESARVIDALGGSGSVFAADQFGGYLIWALGPRHRPFMDTRLVLRTRAEFEEYLAVVDEPARFDAWQRDKGFDYALLPVAYPDRYLGLVAHLYASDDWDLVYTDGAEALFARRGLASGSDTAAFELESPEVVDRIGAGLDVRFGGAPRLRESARAQLSTLLLTVGLPRQAERVLSELTTPLADALRARCRLAAGDLAGAATLAEASLHRDPADTRSLGTLALVAASRGDSSRALELLRRTLEVDPYDKEAKTLLVNWEGP